MPPVAMRLMCLWPGLPQLWWRGQVSWLLVAVGFAGLINLAIASSVLCPGLLPPAGVLGVWCAAAGLWGLSLWQSQQHWEQILPTPSGAAGEALFATAQTQYLRGDWEEVEALAAGVLQQHPDDVEFRLLLAAVEDAPESGSKPSALSKTLFNGRAVNTGNTRFSVSWPGWSNARCGPHRHRPPSDPESWRRQLRPPSRLRPIRTRQLFRSVGRGPALGSGRRP